MKGYTACQLAPIPLGRALGFLNDLHPFEVDLMGTDKTRCDSLDVRRKRALSCAERNDVMRMLTGCQPPRPGAFMYDGRLLNRLGERRFLRDPCRHWRNVHPWEPHPPQVFRPRTGHYRGLGTPPKQFFRLRQMHVLGNRSMPAYELLRPQDME